MAVPETVPTTVVTWNVNSLRSRLDHVLTFLRDHSPDVLCLQELKCEEKALPKEAFTELGYNIVAHCQKTYNGVAIISPYPIDDVQMGFTDGAADPQARLITTTVRGMRIINAYVVNGSEVGSDKYDYKLEWLARLSDELSNHHDPAQPTLLCGDFNVAVDDRDLYDPEGWAGRVLCSDPEREGVARWADWGFTDTFRQHHDEAGLYSWWDYRMGAFQRDRGLRIDHVWVTEPLVSRCSACEVIKTPRSWEKPSDHAPVMATFSGLEFASGKS